MTLEDGDTESRSEDRPVDAELGLYNLSGNPKEGGNSCASPYRSHSRPCLYTSAGGPLPEDIYERGVFGDIFIEAENN